MPNIPKLSPENQFPKEAIQESVQVQPEPAMGSTAVPLFMIGVATVADQITPWGRNTKIRDRQLRDFWPTESYLAGAVANVSFRNSAFDWEIKGGSERVNQAVTDMLQTAIAGDVIGWTTFIQRLSQDLYTQDNGAFVELIRDPGMDANSKFRGSMAPVIGIANLDSGQCTRTGNSEYPVIYIDRNSREHKLRWYEVIPFSDFPSSIEKMNGVGICAVSRALRLAQIMRSIALFKDEEVGGRNIKKIQIVGGVGHQQLLDAIKRTEEQANNKGNIRYIEHAVLASLDPEKPVSATTVDLASLPEGFNFDQEMQWYIAGLALDFGTDYQEFAPLPGGNIGSASQGNVLNRKTSGKGPRTFMDLVSSAFKNYGVLPRGTTQVFNDKNSEEETEKQVIRTKALEEAAIAVNASILTPEAAARDLVKRGIYDVSTIADISPDFWKNAENRTQGGQLVGSRGGNTIAEDAARQNTGKPRLTVADRLRKWFP